MARWGKLLLVFLAWSCLWAAPAVAEGVNRALLIGCDRFVTQQDTTPASANNVSRMAMALSGGAMNLETLVTRREGIDSVDELSELIAETFAQADEGDVSYFYISTHGLWPDGLDAGSMTFVLSTGERESGVTARELRAMFDRVPGTKVLLLDACHSGSVIGKGVDAGFENVFEGPDYKVICSSGGAEESWFWSGMADHSGRSLGSGYFSDALVSALSSAGGFGADTNRDGTITLTELKRYLRLYHGASTVQTYPEEDDFPVLTYAASTFSSRRRDSALENISFEEGVLSPLSPEISFSFTVLRDVQVAYQVVCQKNGRWDFDRARLIWDNEERFGAYGDAQGYLSPGYKERTITLTDGEGADSYGYVLVQILTISGGQVSVAASRVLCVPPERGDPGLVIDGEEGFNPDLREELTFVVRHAFPCELSVTVEDAAGNVVDRLASRLPSRPEQLSPTGTTFTWNGRTSGGETAPAGEYVICVTSYVGEERYTLRSSPVHLEREG